MIWPPFEDLATLSPLPVGYGYAAVESGHIAPLIAKLKAWHPDISVGTSSCYLREDFYRNRVTLDGERDRDVWATLITHEGETVGFWSVEREADSLAVYGRLLVIAPEHRGGRISVHALIGSENIARSMGAQFSYGFATLKHPYVQRAFERSGYRLLGFFPGRDREEIAPGVVKRVYQGVYAKLLVPADQVHWPDPKNMTPRARALYALLFSDVAAAR